MRKLKFILVLFLLIMAIAGTGIVSGSPTYVNLSGHENYLQGEDLFGMENVTAGGSATTQLSSGDAGAGTYANFDWDSPLLKAFTIETTTGSSIVSVHDQIFTFIGSYIQDHNQQTYAIPVDVNLSTTSTPGGDTGVVYGHGTLTLHALGNVSMKYGTLPKDMGIYDVELDFSYWNPGALTGNQYFLLRPTSRQYYNITWGDKYGESRASAGFGTPTVPFMAFMTPNGLGEPRTATHRSGWPTATLLTYVKDSGDFQNDVFSLYDYSTKKITTEIDRWNFTATGRSGYSNITVSDGTDYLIISNTTGYDNISFTSFNPPLRIHIKDPATGWIYDEQWWTILSPVEIPGFYNVTFHVRTRSGQDVPNAHLSFMYDSSHAYGGTVSGYTNNTGMISFGAVPGAAAAVVDVTASGYPEYIETFTLNHDLVKNITLASPTLNLFLDVYESQTGAYLDGVNIGIKNTTSGVWRNTTDHSGAAYFDSTGANYEYPLSINETVIVEAHKAGYLSDWKSVIIPYDRYRVALHLSNINGTQPTSGNFTAVIAIGSATTGLEIPGGSITIQELGRMSATNMAGVATFRDLPVGTYTALGAAAGYQSSMTTITGTDQETVMTRIRLLPNGCSIGEGGIVKCQNETYGITPTPGNQTPNQKAAGGLTAFLDNIVSIGIIVVLGICIWAGKKVILG